MSIVKNLAYLCRQSTNPEHKPCKRVGSGNHIKRNKLIALKECRTKGMATTLKCVC